ncbi:MAG: hypothetical protein FWB71_05370 [Defluviitaleaceae bacterium]|nr:hypothetical protein [Defluviitaleaceae bacterium]
MKLSETGLALFKGVLVICALALIGGGILSPYPLMFCLGVLIGAFSNLMRLLLLERAVNLVMESNATGDAKSLMRRGYMSRSLVSIVALVAAFQLLGPQGLWGAAIGVISLHFAAFLVGFFLKEKDSAVPPKTDKIDHEQKGG